MGLYSSGVFMPLMGLYSLRCWLIDEWESCFNTLNSLALGATAGALGATLGATAGHHSNTRNFFMNNLQILTLSLVARATAGSVGMLCASRGKCFKAPGGQKPQV